MAAIRVNPNRHVEIAIDAGTITALAHAVRTQGLGGNLWGLKIGAHPLGPKREAGPIKHPGPERRPRKEKPSSLAPEAYDVDN